MNKCATLPNPNRGNPHKRCGIGLPPRWSSSFSMALPTCASAVRLRHQHWARVLLLLDLPPQYLRQLPLTLCLCFICHVIILYSACHCFFCVSLKKKKVIEKITKRNKKTTSRWKIVKNWKSYSKCVVNQHPTFTYNISILWRLAEFYWFLVKVLLLV